MAQILDLDGVLWRGERPVPGAAEAVGRLRAEGERVLFVTNNSSARVAEYAAKLERMGTPDAAADLVTSAQAAASLLEPGSRALVCAGPGVAEALEHRGVHPVAEGDADAVVVGWHRTFDYARLTAAFLAIRRGARFVATNDDPTYPTPDGEIPGGGAIVAAVATAAGVAPEIAGKPHPPMVALIRERVGQGEPLVVVGDRPSTDGRLARSLGARFALVLSGVTAEAGVATDPAPDEVAADLAALVAGRYSHGLQG
jgi:HAD superfamily hydrolase (TIGR01450 family)